MSQQNKELLWTWILRFVNVVRFLAWTILLMTVIAYAVYLQEFLKSDQAQPIATLWFVAGLTASIVSMWLWLRNYKHTAHMIRHQNLEEGRLLRISYNLLSLYVLEWFLTLRSWMGPEFTMEKRISSPTEPQEGTVVYSFDLPKVTLSENIPYITPVTEGMATLVLAFVILYWAKSIGENQKLQNELSEIV